MLPIEAIVAPRFPPHHLQELPQRMAAFASGDDSVRVRTDDIDLIRKDGSGVTTETVTNLLAGQDRKVRLIVGVSRDISARRGADEILRGTDERYRQYFKTDPDSVFFQHLMGNGWIVMMPWYKCSGTRAGRITVPCPSPRCMPTRKCGQSFLHGSNRMDV